jgi:sulfate adenylyltransferase
LNANGGFAQLNGFMNRKDYDSVCKDFRLADGRLFSIPIYFDVSAETKDEIEKKGGNLVI